MVAVNLDMHLAAHDRVKLAQGRLHAAQATADFYKPVRGELPSIDYLNAVNQLTIAVGEYGDAIAALGGILRWKSSMRRFR